ncbi:MAG: efflux RND transporter periplasmic adaptor subunit, partial [Planctomycetota bacterium]
FVVVVAAIAGGAFIVSSAPEVDTVVPEPVVPLVRVLEVQPTAMTQRVTSNGTVMPRTEATLVAEVSGRIVSVAESFASGGFFEAGEELVRLDARDYELALTRAEAEVARAEVAVAREEAEGDMARREWTALGRTGEPPALVARGPQLAEARAAVAAAGAALAQAELNLERTRILAPYAGRVREKQADIGQFVGATQPLARIYAADYAEVRLPVADDQLAFLDLPLAYRGGSSTPGPSVRLTATFAGQVHEWRGRIVRTEGEIDPRTRTLNLIARIDDPYARQGNRPPLAVGMFVESDIEGRRVPDLVALPRVAIRDGDVPRVLVVDGNTLRFRTVTVTRREGDVVYVSEGLTAGDRVCISPLEAPTDGMLVRTQPEQGDPSADGAAR